MQNKNQSLKQESMKENTAINTLTSELYDQHVIMSGHHKELLERIVNI